MRSKFTTTIALLVALLFATSISMYGRVIPEFDVRALPSAGATFGIENSGRYGTEIPLLYPVGDTLAARYTYSSGWVVVGKAEGQWFTLSTVDIPAHDADALPGSPDNGEYDAAFAPYQQVFFADGYDTDTGQERFGGLGPNWPLWKRTAYGSIEFYFQWRYGSIDPDTTFLRQSGFPLSIAPSFPDHLKALTYSRLEKPELGVSLQLNVFYSDMDDSGTVTTAQLLNKSEAEIDSVYLFHITDTEINNPESAFEGTANDVSFIDTIPVDNFVGETPLTVSYSLRGLSELDIKMNNFHTFPLWQSHKESDTQYPTGRERFNRRQASSGFIMYSGLYADLLVEDKNLVEVLTNGTTNSRNEGDVISAIGTGPYTLGTNSLGTTKLDNQPYNAMIQLVTGFTFSDISNSGNGYIVESVSENISKLFRAVVEGSYLSVEKEDINSPKENKNRIYYNQTDGYYIIIDDNKVKIDLRGGVGR